MLIQKKTSLAPDDLIIFPITSRVWYTLYIGGAPHLVKSLAIDARFERPQNCLFELVNLQ